MIDLNEYLIEISLPWKNNSFIGGAGLLACGWTANNKVFLLFPDYYILGNPITGEIETMVEKENLLTRLSKDNLEFDLKEYKQSIKVFGLRGGNGNHYTTDRWRLIEIAQGLHEKVFGISDYRNFGRTETKFWKNYDLIKLENLEFGQWCGFSPNEKYFGIFGSGGVELFHRE